VRGAEGVVIGVADEVAEAVAPAGLTAFVYTS
jgi:hypothetical protein